MVPAVYINRQAVCKPRVVDWFKALRNSEAANLPLGASGFCWGGQYVALLCSDRLKAECDGQSLVDAGFTAHPSALTLPDDIEALSKPVSIANGTLDWQLTVPRMEQVKEIFARKEAGKFELVVYDRARHGFALRGNPNNKKELEHAKEAEEQALRWFKKWLVPTAA